MRFQTREIWPKSWYVFCVILSAVTSFLILNRWLFTELGELSFGRLWMYFVSYFDFGLIRRGLIGTLVDLSYIEVLIRNEFLLVYFLHGLSVLLLYIAFIKFTWIYNGSSSLTNNFFVVSLFLSPTLFGHFSYVTGTLDTFVFIWFIFALVTKKPTYFFAILFSGPFVHESFLFFIPTILAFRFIQNQDWFRDKKNVSTLTLTLLLMAYFLRFTYQRSFPQSKYEDLMKNVIPENSRQYMDLWSGYPEIFSSIEDNNRIGLKSLYYIAENFEYITIPLIYCALVAVVTASTWRGLTFKLRILLFSSLLFPLLIQFVAGDTLRWVSFSANASLTVMCLGLRTGQVALRLRTAIALVPFIFFNPFGGSQLSDPFPLLRFLFLATNQLN